MKQFEGQLIVITGGGTGIGRSTAIQFALKGAKVVITGRTIETLNSVVEEITNLGGYAEAYQMDVTNEIDVNEKFSAIIEKHGKVDILYSNAGNSEGPNLSEFKNLEDLDSLVKTHIYGTIYCVRAVVPSMKAQKYGRIILCSSIGASNGLYGNQYYSMVKAGLNGYTFALCKELGQFGITVNSVLPGVIATGLATVFEDYFKAIKEETPMRALGTGEDVAHAVVYLASKEAGFITGQVLKIDGGYSIQLGNADKMFIDVVNSLQKK